SFSNTYEISDYPAPVIFDGNMVIVSASCGNSNGFIVNIIVSGSTELTYEWTNSGGNPVGTEPDLIDVPAEIYSLKVTDENSCESFAGPYQVDDIAGPEINDSNTSISDATCGESNGSITGLEVFGSSALTYEWTDNIGNPVGNELDLTGILPGIYTLKVTDELLCESFAGPFQINNIGGALIDNITYSDATCEFSNGSIEIEASGGFGIILYSIDNGNNWQGNNIFSNISPGIYNIFIKDDAECITIYAGNPVIIENYGEQVIAQASSNTPVCEGDDLQMTCDIDNASYLWEGPNSFISTVQNPVINNVNLSDAGTYSVKVTTSPYNCSDSVSTDVDVLESYAVDISISVSENPIYPGYSVVFTAIAQNPGGNPVYEWMIDGTIVQSGPSNTFTTSSIYKDQIVTCRLIPSEPCSTPNPAFSNEIMMKVQVTIFYLPNSFNPNSVHGNNEFTVITSSTNIPGFTMYIYNKWGQLIFKTNDVNEGWDGMVKGKPAPKDVYVWVVKYSDYSESESAGKTVEKKGTVTLIR
ncbi:MAG: gliding motility-associated C-terminal domain-containing protein, partial [Bacteroidales bacterium]|nr:gliding motility-associated C-terminal domain-containing protein [Bacteroidales bacterium]